MKIYKDIKQTIGSTPLVKLNNIVKDTGWEIFAKLEFFNPLGSVKDRIAASMIDDAEAKGKIGKKTLIVEPTSGNTGIALAFIAAARGYRLCLTMPETMSMERQKLLRHLGAELVLTPGPKGMKGAIEEAEKIVKNNSDTFTPNQFENPANPMIHEKTTGEEIWNDTDGNVDIFIACVGTGGTITGVARALKKKKPDIKIIAVEPYLSPVLSGGQAGAHKIQGIGAGFVPKILDMSLIDQVIKIKDEEAFDTARNLAKKEGILCGISSGAAVRAAIKVAMKNDSKEKNIVVILPSTGERYISTDLFKDAGAK